MRIVPLRNPDLANEHPFFLEMAASIPTAPEGASLGFLLARDGAECLTAMEGLDPVAAMIIAFDMSPICRMPRIVHLYSPLGRLDAIHALCDAAVALLLQKGHTTVLAANWTGGPDEAWT